MVVITDIFGNNNINNNTPFIIVFGNNLNKYLIHKDSNKGDNTLTDETSHIFTINKKNIAELFNKYHVNFNSFIISSDLLVFKNGTINKLLFINKNLGKIPEDFISVELYNKGTIWQPIGAPGYKSIGLIYSSQNKKPKLNSIYMLPIDILLKINHGPLNGLNTFNEYKNLSNDIHGYWTIDKERISQDTNDYFKLLTFDGKYLTRLNDKFTLYNSKNTKDDSEQIIRYSINGDIIVKNKCLSNNNNKLMFEQCNNNINKKWSIINNNIVSNKNNQCLSIDQNDNIILEECDDENQYQQFTKESPDFINYNDFKWKNNKGRNVILTFNNNPWYLNKDLNVDLSKMKDRFTTKIPQSIKSKVSTYGLKNNYAKYKNNDLNIIENFEGDNFNTKDLNTSWWTIISILIILLIILLFIYKKKNILFRN
jgi:hypothetical protein